MGRVLLLFTVLCSVLFAETAVDIRKKKVVVRSLAQCKNARNLPLIWYNFKVGINDKTNDTTLGIQVRSKNEITKDLAIAFNFMKCDASGNPDSCEYVLKDYKVTDICTFMTAKDEVWTSFIDHFDKPIYCPIKPGVYTLSDMPISPNFLTYFPISDATWKITMNGYDRGSPLSCVELVLQIVPFYVKRQ